MKILYLQPQENPRTCTEAFRLAAAVSGFHGIVCTTPEELQSQSRTLSQAEELHYLVCDLESRSVAQTLLTERGFVHSVATIHSTPLRDEQKRALQSGFARHVLPVACDSAAQAPSLREQLLSTFRRWKTPRLSSLACDLPRADCLRMTIQNPRHRGEALAKIEDLLSGFSPLASGRFKSTFIPRAVEVADEFILNAVAASGADPEHDFELSTDERISVSFGFDGGMFGVSVEDAHGSLLPWTFFRKAFGLNEDSSTPEPAGIPSRASLGLGLRASLAISQSLTAQVASGRFCCMTALVPYERASTALKPKRLEYFAL